MPAVVISWTVVIKYRFTVVGGCWFTVVSESRFTVITTFGFTVDARSRVYNQCYEKSPHAPCKSYRFKPITAYVGSVDNIW